MSDQPVPPVPPAEAPQPPHEGPWSLVGNLLHHDRPAPAGEPVVPAAVLRGHAAEAFRIAGDLLEAQPGAEPLASRILQVALGVARVAGIAL